MNTLRRGLPPLPELFKHLPIDERGYPVPWFVSKVDGKFDFRLADARKRERAVRDRLCWLCGIGCPKELAFVIGPMCAVNRNTSEPGCHIACAEFAVQACPFMVRPAAQYRAANLPKEARGHFGSLGGNPGASCIWITRQFRKYAVPGGWLIRLGDPLAVQWWTEGRRATRAEILECMANRLPALAEMATAEGPLAEQAFVRAVREVEPYLPA